MNAHTMTFRQFIAEQEQEEQVQAQTLAQAIKQAGSKENIQKVIAQSGARTIEELEQWLKSHPNVKKILNLYNQAKNTGSSGQQTSPPPVQENWISDSVSWVWDKVLKPIGSWLVGEFVATVRAMLRPLGGLSITPQKLLYIGALAIMVTLPVHALLPYAGLMWFGNRVLAPALQTWEKK